GGKATARSGIDFDLLTLLPCSSSRLTCLCMCQPTTERSTRRHPVSRRLECYRARIVAPFAMLLSRAYGESHREYARQGRIRAGYLSALPAGAAPGEAADPGRVLPG